MRQDSRIVSTPGKRLNSISFLYTFWIQVQQTSALSFLVSRSINSVSVAYWCLCNLLTHPQLSSLVYEVSTFFRTYVISFALLSFLFLFSICVLFCLRHTLWYKHIPYYSYSYMHVNYFNYRIRILFKTRAMKTMCFMI